ncbi:MAG: hypothetical protein HY235_27940 [Acidobacteria bacterium]|nr:hypothetical protein [Acidobacteriota bacterium]
MRIAILLLGAAAAFAQRNMTYEGSTALEFANDKIELVMLPQGGAFVSMALKEDARRVNPMWDPVRMARERGLSQQFGPSKGHFVCVDGFGPTTREEQAAGLAFHGEANKLPWEVLQSGAAEATFRVKLPMVQEIFTRKISIAPGEQIVMVESELESLLGFDRVILWAEHATIGAPFLKLGKVAVDASSTQCRTKPHTEKGPRTFPSGRDFQWPVVGKESVRVTPASDGVMNHIGCLMDPKREHEFITAFNTEEKLILGYLFRRADYPWVQHWMNYPANGMYAWGLEFGMQPYDMTKQEILALTPMFGAPTFRWLPAKSKVETRFLMFLAKAPEGFRRVEDVRIESGRLVVEDQSAGKKITLRASRGL